MPRWLRAIPLRLWFFFKLRGYFITGKPYIDDLLIQWGYSQYDTLGIRDAWATSGFMVDSRKPRLRKGRRKGTVK